MGADSSMKGAQNTQWGALALPNMHAFGIGARLGFSYYF